MSEMRPSYDLSLEQPGLLIYDGHCHLCVRVVDGLQRAGVGDAPSGVRFVPYESAEAKAALGTRYQPGPPAMAWWVASSGTMRQGLEAFLPIAPALPGGAAVQRVLRWRFVWIIANACYRWVARHRYRLLGAVRRPPSAD